MNQPNKVDATQGSQKVVYDHILARIPGGVHVLNDADFKTRMVEDVLPAGTAIMKDGDDFKVMLEAGLADAAGVVGLTENDIEGDDFPLVSIVTDAVVRLEAIPTEESTAFTAIKALVPGLKPYH